MILLCLFSDQGFFKLGRLKAMEARRQRENISLADKNNELQAEIARLKTQTYLEKLIREKMGYVRPGEIMIELASP